MRKIAKSFEKEYDALLSRAKRLEGKWVRYTDGAGDRVGAIKDIYLNTNGLKATVDWKDWDIEEDRLFDVRDLQEW